MGMCCHTIHGFSFWECQLQFVIIGQVLASVTSGSHVNDKSCHASQNETQSGDHALLPGNQFSTTVSKNKQIDIYKN